MAASSAHLLNNPSQAFSYQPKVSHTVGIPIDGKIRDIKRDGTVAGRLFDPMRAAYGGQAVEVAKQATKDEFKAVNAPVTLDYFEGWIDSLKENVAWARQAGVTIPKEIEQALTSWNHLYAKAISAAHQACAYEDRNNPGNKNPVLEPGPGGAMPPLTKAQRKAAEKYLNQTFHKGDPIARAFVQSGHAVNYIKQYVSTRAHDLGKALAEGRASGLEKALIWLGVREAAAKDIANEYINGHKSSGDLEVIQKGLKAHGIAASDKIVEFAAEYHQGVKRWSDQTKSFLQKDKAEDGQYIIFDHAAGGQRRVSLSEKAKHEALQDMEWAVQSWLDEPLKQRFAKILEQKGGVAALRLRGEAYNGALYSLNPHDQSRQAIARVYLKLIGEHLKEPEKSRTGLRMLFGPCGAPQTLWSVLGGPLGANRHITGLTSLDDPHCGDFHEVDGLQSCEHDRTYMKISRGSELYESFERLADANEQNIRYDEHDNIIAPIDCVHSQIMINIEGAEQEVGRHLLRALGYQNVDDASVKVTGISCGKDGQDSPYQMMGGQYVFGETKGSSGPMPLQVGRENPGAQELVSEGVEFYANGQPIGIFTQNHDDAYRESTNGVTGDEMLPWSESVSKEHFSNQPGARNFLYHQVFRGLGLEKLKTPEEYRERINRFLALEANREVLTDLKKWSGEGWLEYLKSFFSASNDLVKAGESFNLSNQHLEELKSGAIKTLGRPEDMDQLERKIKKLFRSYKQYKKDFGDEVKEILKRPVGEMRADYVKELRKVKDQKRRDNIVEQLNDFYRNQKMDTQQIQNLLLVFESNAWASAALKVLQALHENRGEVNAEVNAKVRQPIEALSRSHVLDEKKMESTLKMLEKHLVSGYEGSLHALKDKVDKGQMRDRSVYFYPRAQKKGGLSKLFRANWKNISGNSRLPGGIAGIVTGGTFLSGLGMIVGGLASTVLSGASALFSAVLLRIGYQLERDAGISDRRLKENAKHKKELLELARKDMDTAFQKKKDDIERTLKDVKHRLHTITMLPSSQLAELSKTLDSLDLRQKPAQAILKLNSLKVKEIQKLNTEIGNELSQLLEILGGEEALINAANRVQTYESYLETVKREKNDNFFTRLTGRGYMGGAGMLLGSSALAIASVFTPIPALAAGVAGIAAFATLAGVYLANAFKSKNEKKLSESVHRNEGVWQPKVIGYVREFLNRLYDRPHLFSHMNKAWLRGGLVLGGMAMLSAGFVAANVFTAGAPLMITGAVLGGAMLLGSVPLFKDTFNLFNRYAAWKGKYPRGNDSMPHVWGKEFSEDKKEFWNLGKQSGQVLETNMRILETFDQEIIRRMTEYESKTGKTIALKSEQLPGRNHNSRNHWPAFLKERFLNPNRKSELIKQAIQGKAETGGVLSSEDQLSIVRPLLAYNMMDYALLEKNSLVNRTKSLSRELSAMKKAEHQGYKMELYDQVLFEHQQAINRLKGVNAFIDKLQAYQANTQNGRVDGTKQQRNGAVPAWEDITTGFAYHMGLLPHVLGSQKEQRNFAAQFKHEGVRLEEYSGPLGSKHIANLSVSNLSEMPDSIKTYLKKNASEQIADLYAYVLPGLLSTEVNALYEREMPKRTPGVSEHVLKA